MSDKIAKLFMRQSLRIKRDFKDDLSIARREVFWDFTENILRVKQISYVSILNGQLNGDGRITDALIS